MTTRNLGENQVLEKRFASLWRSSLLPEAGDKSHRIWSELAERYAQPHRSYHTIQHVAFCLQQFDMAADLIPTPAAVELAIWFHDVIYDAAAGDNEARSARFFRARAEEHLHGSMVDTVSDLIMVTRHQTAPEELDQQFLCDIDLASFGCPWDCFLRDSANVKDEHAGPEAAYFTGQKRFLEGLLARPRIFMTDLFNGRYERQARENITHLLRQQLDR